MNEYIDFPANATWTFHLTKTILKLYGDAEETRSSFDGYWHEPVVELTAGFAAEASKQGCMYVPNSGNGVACAVGAAIAAAAAAKLPLK